VAVVVWNIANERDSFIFSPQGKNHMAPPVVPDAIDARRKYCAGAVGATVHDTAHFVNDAGSFGLSGNSAVSMAGVPTADVRPNPTSVLEFCG
jgi:hypothetical protein